MKKNFYHLLLFSMLSAGSPLALGNPVGEAVKAGSATVHRFGPGSLVVNQSSDKVIIDWTSFSIGAGETTRFIQQSSHSAALNRVLGGDPTSIYGRLDGNGRVYVINPAGILVGPGGVINTRSFVGSTLDVKNSSFLSGVGMRFSGDSRASVRNEGNINALGGDIFLVSHTVQNAGTLNAPQGTVGLAAGNEVLLRQSGDERISVVAGNASSSQAAVGVDNVGAIQAASVELKAAGGNMYALAINNGGIARADTIVNQGGRILLKASGGNIQNSGTLAASGPGGTGGKITLDGGHNATTPATVTSSGTIDARGASGKGGDVKVLGDHVGLFGSALVDVSGETGGGTALIGGDYQGKNSAVQNAQRTFVGKETTIKADALSYGSGGKIIVWADDVTRFFGSISARGGTLGGNGGFAEVSGKSSLIFDGAADLRGRGDFAVVGTLLLDPKNIIVSTLNPGGGAVPESDRSDLNSFSDGAPNQTSWLTPAQLVTLLDGADTELRVNNDFTFHDSVDATGGSVSAHDLTIEAGHSIFVGDSAAVTISLKGKFTGTANINDSGVDLAERDNTAAVFSMFAGSTINTLANAGNINITMGAGKNGALAGDVTIANLNTTPSAAGANAFSVTVNNHATPSHNIVVTGTINTSGANGGGDGGAGGAIVLNASGNLDLSAATVTSRGGDGSGGSGKGGVGGAVTLTAGQNLSAAGITADGGTGSGDISGAGGAIIAGSSGNMNLNGTVSSRGGNGGVATSAGGAGGAITLNSGGTLSAAAIVADGGVGNGAADGTADIIDITAATGITLSGNISTKGSDPSAILLKTTSGGVNQSGGALLTDGLFLSGAGTFSLNQPGNNISRLAADLTGSPTSLTFQESDGFTVGTVNSVDGISFSASGSGLTLKVAGDNGLLNVSKAISAAGGNITLTADRMTIAADISASAGRVTLTPTTPMRVVTVGTDDVDDLTAATGTLGLTATEIAHVKAGANGVLKIGDLNSGPLSITAPSVIASTTAGTLSLESKTTIGQAALAIITVPNLALRAGTTISLTENNVVNTLAATAGGTIAFNNSAPLAVGVADSLNGLLGNAVTLTTTLGLSDLTLNNDITTRGGAVDLSGVSAIKIGGDVTIDTDETGGSSAAGNVNFGAAAINGSGASHNLVIDATADGGGASAAVTLNDVGQGTALQSLNVLGATISLKKVTTTTGIQSYTADTITLTDDLKGSGALVLQPLDPTLPISIGSVAVGALSFDATALSHLIDGFSSITFGRANGSHAINVTAGNFTDTVAFRSPLGSTTLNGDLQNNGGGGFDFTAAGSVNMAVASVTIDTDLAGGSTAAGAVNFGSTPINSVFPAAALRIDTTADGGGNNGSIGLGPVGNFTALGNLTFLGGSLTLGGDINVDGGAAVDFTGVTDVKLATNVRIDTDAPGGPIFGFAGNVIFGSVPVEAAVAGSTLTIDVTSDNVIGFGGSVTLGRVGGTTAATALGGLTVFGSSLTLNDNIQVDGGGAVDFSGVSFVSLAGNVRIDTDVTGGGTAAGNVNFGFASVDGNSAGRTLTIDGTSDSGAAGAITLGPIGQGTALASVDVSGASVSAQAVRTTGNQTYTADTLSLNGNLIGGGTLTLQPLDPTTSIGLGNLAVGTFNLDSTELAFIQNGFAGINIGRADGQHAVDVRAVTFSDPVLIRAPAGAGAITVNGQITGTDDASVKLDGSAATTLNAGITTDNQDIVISDNVVLGNSVTLDTGSSGGGKIQIDGTVNATIAGAEGLTLQAGTGNVILNGAVGNSKRLDHLLINSATDISLVGVNAITTVLTASGSLNGLGTVTSDNLGIDVVNGIGSAGSHLATAVARLEARTVNGGIFIDNTGPLAIGGVSAGLNGVSVTTSGDIVLQNAGTISVRDGGDSIKGPGNVTVRATGAGSDILTGGSQPAIVSSGAASLVTLDAAHDLILGDTASHTFGDVRGGSVLLKAGNDVIVDQFTYIDGTVTDVLTPNGGTVTVNAGHDIKLLNSAGSPGLAHINTSGGAIQLTTGADGALVIDPNINVDSRFGAVNGAITIAAGTITHNGNINAGTASADITHSGALTGNGSVKAGVLTLQGAGDVGTLAGRLNTTVDKIIFNKSGASAFVNESDAVTIQGNAATMDLVAGGVVNQSGTITAPTLRVKTKNDAGAGINLDAFVNEATTIDLQARNAADTDNAAGTIAYKDATGVGIAALRTASDSSITANGDITQSGVITVNQSGKTATFTAGAANNVLLDTVVNDFSRVVVTSGNNVRIKDANGLILGGSTISGDLDVTVAATSAGDLTQDGVILANGANKTATFTAGSGNNVTLDTLGNDFTRVVVASANNVKIKDANALVLGASTISGDLEVTVATASAGDLTQNGVILANGANKTATFTAGAGNNVILDTPGNDFTKVTVVSGNNVKLKDATALELGASTISGDLEVTAGGPITQSGAITADGIGKTASFSAAGQNITLDNLNNDFRTAKFVGADVTVKDKDALDLGVSTVTGDLNVTAGGNITQSGALTANGAGKLATFNVLGASAASDILLNDLNNDFVSVSVPGANNIIARNVTLSDKNGFTLVGVKASDTLSLNTAPGAGDITQILNPGDAALSQTIEAHTLLGTLGGGLVLGNTDPNQPASQPLNKFTELGPIVHGGLLYIFDSDNAAYASGQNPVSGNGNVPLGLTINGAISGSGKTVIRTVGDLVLKNRISSANGGRNENDIELSAEKTSASADNTGNFHNLFGGTPAAPAIDPGNNSRFLVFSSDRGQNFGNAVKNGKLTFNGLGADFLAEKGTFNDHPTPIIKQNGQRDNGQENGFVFVRTQNFKQQDEAAKFFLDLLSIEILTGVDAEALAGRRPPEQPPTVWTSTYHIYEEEMKLKEERERKKKRKLVHTGPIWQAAAAQR